MLKVREKRVKQKFDWSDKSLEYSIRRVGTEVGKGKEEYYQAPFMSQLLSVNTNMHSCVVFPKQLLIASIWKWRFCGWILSEYGLEGQLQEKVKEQEFPGQWLNNNLNHEP